MATVTEFTRVLAIPLPERVRLPKWAFAVDLGDGRLQFRSPRTDVTVAAPDLVEIYARVRDRLDTSSTVEELVREAGGSTDPQRVVFLLKILRAHGFLQAAVPPGLIPQEAAGYARAVAV